MHWSFSFYSLPPSHPFLSQAKKKLLQGSEPNSIANLNQKAGGGGGGGETSVLSQKAGGGGIARQTSVLSQRAGGGGGNTAVIDTTAAVNLSNTQVADKQWHTAPLPPPPEAHRDVLSDRHHGTSVSASGNHKTVSPRRRLFVAGSDKAEGPEGKKRAGHPTKVCDCTTVGIGVAVVQQLYIHLYVIFHSTVLQDPYVLLTALVRGYLTRRLLKSEKVQSLVNTVKVSEPVNRTVEM